MHFIIGTDLEINGGFSVPGLQPCCHHPQRCARLTKALTLSSSPFWPFSTALFNAHKSHTGRCWILGEGIDRDIWLLVDNMHNWGLWKQVISPQVEACDSQTPSLVPCVHCCGRSPQPEWATHSLFHLLQPGKLRVRAAFSLRDPQTGSLIIVTNKSNNCSIIWELHSTVTAFWNTLLQRADGPVLGRDSSLEEPKY